MSVFLYLRFSNGWTVYLSHLLIFAMVACLMSVFKEEVYYMAGLLIEVIEFLLKIFLKNIIGTFSKRIQGKFCQRFYEEPIVRSLFLLFL